MKKIISIMLVILIILSTTFSVGAINFEATNVGFANTVTNQSAFSVEIYGDYCYVSSRAGGIQIFNISDIDNVENIANNSDMTSAMQTDGDNVRIYNNYLYAGFTAHLAKFSLDEPENPVLETSTTDAKKVKSMTFKDNLMFATNDSGTLYVFDITDDGLELIKSISTDSEIGKHRALYSYEDYLYVSCERGIKIYDIAVSDYNDLFSESLVSISLDTTNINEICVNENGIYFSNWGANAKIYMIDTSDISDLSSLTIDDVVAYEHYYGDNIAKPRGLVIEGDILYCTFNEGIFAVLDVSDISNPILLGEITGVGMAPDVEIVNSVAYLACRDKGIQIIPIPQYTYMIFEDVLTEFPSELKIKSLGDVSDYNMYVDGIKIKARALEGGSAIENIQYLSNGNHKIGIAVDGSDSVNEYDITVDAGEPLSIELLDESDAVINNIDMVEGAKIKVSNSTQESREAYLIAALYSENTMKDYKYFPITVSDYGYTEEELEFSDTVIDSNCKIKIFVVDSYEVPALLSDVYELTGDNYSNLVFTTNLDSTELFDMGVTSIEHNVKNVEIGLVKNTIYGDKTVVAVTAPQGTDFDDLDYIDVIETINGKGGINYCFKSNIEEYPFSVVSSTRDIFGGYLTKKDNFTYVGQTSIDNLLLSLSTSSDTENILKTNSDMFRIDMSEESMFYGLGEKYRNKILISMKANFETIDSVKSKFDLLIKEAYALKEINDAADDEAIKAILTNDDKLQTLKINKMVVEAMDDDTIKLMCEYLLNTDESNKKYSVDEFSENFNNKAAVELINNTGYLQMGNILELFSDKFDLTGDYSKLSNKENELIYVHKLLERTDYATVEEAVAKFNSAVSTAINNKKNSSSGVVSRPTGGGGGGGGSVSRVTMSGTPEVSNQTSNNITPIVNEKFLDISDVAWAKNAINYLADKSIISGYPDNTFKPNSMVTREEFAKMLCVALNIAKEEKSIKNFEDVSENDWYYEYVVNLNSAGIINGISDSMFGTGAELTREDLAVMIAKAASYKNINIATSGEVEFNDSNDISDYAKESVAVLANSGIMVGYNNYFEPKGSVTRAMAAKVIFELLNI